MADDRRNSLLSGRIGVPDGAYRLLNDPIERAVENIVRNELTITNIVQEEENGGGTAVEVWGRFKADGTKITGSTDFVLTESRTSDGNYTVTSTKTAGSSGGNYLFGVLVSVSSKSGDGGDGVSPIKAYSSHEVVDTDDFNAPNWFYSSATGKIYLLGPNVDDVFVHNVATNFTTAATQVPFSSTVRSGVRDQGVLSSDGALLWKSGEAAVPVEVMRTSDNSIVTFANKDAVMKAADSTSIYVKESSQLVKYTPNLSTPTLGASVQTWAVDPAAALGCWDGDGYLWVIAGGMYQVNPSGSDIVQHDFPSGTWTSGSDLFYDPNRRRIYLTLNGTSTDYYLYEFKNWTNLVGDSGEWTLIAALTDGTTGIYYDPASDIIITMNTGLGTVSRWGGDPKTIIDVVSVDNTTPDNAQVDYDLSGTWRGYYTPNYAIVSAAKAGQDYLIKINYEGDAIDFGSGAGLLNSVLVPMYEITGATTSKVYLSRPTNPPVLADGEHTVKFIYP